MEVQCKTDCWDSEKCFRYEHGKKYDVDKKDPLFKHFVFIRKSKPVEGEEQPADIPTGKE